MFKIADVVTFNKNAEVELEGVISRVWTNGKYVSILVDGRSTYVRDIRNVRLESKCSDENCPVTLYVGTHTPGITWHSNNGEMETCKTPTE